MNSDFFIENPPDQPKRDIGRYIASVKKIPTPVIYKSLTDSMEALKEGKEIICRGELTEEYNGVSGLLNSYIFNGKTLQTGKKESAPSMQKAIDYINEGKNKIPDYYQAIVLTLNSKQNWADTQLFKALSMYHPHSASRIERYCALTDLDIFEFQKTLFYSFWEYIPGVTGSIIKDSAIQGRYHVLSEDYHVVFENNEVVSEYFLKKEKDHKVVRKNLDKIIQLYESVIHLTPFDKAHCYSMEWVIDKKDKVYFLQLHRTRDFRPPSFVLDRAPVEGEILADFVRGATGEEGMLLETLLPGHAVQKRYLGFSAEICNYSKLGDQGFPYGDFQSRARQLNVMDKNFNSQFSRSRQAQLFNPGVSLCCSFSKLIAGFPELLKIQKQFGVVPIRVTSDGRKAYIKVEGTLKVQEG